MSEMNDTGRTDSAGEYVSPSRVQSPSSQLEIPAHPDGHTGSVPFHTLDSKPWESQEQKGETSAFGTSRSAPATAEEGELNHYKSSRFSDETQKALEALKAAYVNGHLNRFTKPLTFTQSFKGQHPFLDGNSHLPKVLQRSKLDKRPSDVEYHSIHWDAIGAVLQVPSEDGKYTTFHDVDTEMAILLTLTLGRITTNQYLHGEIQKSHQYAQRDFWNSLCDSLSDEHFQNIDGMRLENRNVVVWDGMTRTGIQFSAERKDGSTIWVESYIYWPKDYFRKTSSRRSSPSRNTVQQDLSNSFAEGSKAYPNRSGKLRGMSWLPEDEHPTDILFPDLNPSGAFGSDVSGSRKAYIEAIDRGMREKVEREEAARQAAEIHKLEEEERRRDEALKADPSSEDKLKANIDLQQERVEFGFKDDGFISSEEELDLGSDDGSGEEVEDENDEDEGAIASGDDCAEKNPSSGRLDSCISQGRGKTRAE